MNISGAEARIAWGYYVAAQLTGWYAERTDGQWTLSATVVTQDAYRLSQRPLAFEVPRPEGAWRWRVDTLQIEGGALTARLGPKE